MFCRSINKLIVLKLYIVFFTILFSNKTLSKDLNFVTVEHPPHSFVHDGEVVGGITDILSSIFTSMGYSFKAISAPPERALLMLESGQVDGIYPFTVSEERENIAYISDDIACINTVFFKRKDSSITWDSISDLAPYSVGYIAGYNYPVTFLNAVQKGLINGEPLFTQNAILENLLKLKNRRIDLFICNAHVCQFYIDKHSPEYEGIDFIPKTVGPTKTFHIGFSKKRVNARQLRDNFDKALNQAKLEGAISRIYKKWNVTLMCSENSKTK